MLSFFKAYWQYGAAIAGAFFIVAMIYQAGYKIAADEAEFERLKALSAQQQAANVALEKTRQAERATRAAAVRKESELVAELEDIQQQNEQLQRDVKKAKLTKPTIIEVPGTCPESVDWDNFGRLFNAAARDDRYTMPATADVADGISDIAR